MTNEIHGYSEEDIKTIRAVLNCKMNDGDMRVFLHMCRKTNLDPVCRQIYAIPRGGKVTIQTSIDGFRLIADRTGCYAPGKPTEYVYNDKGQLISAISYIKKLAGGVWHEVGEQALLSEYNVNSPFWKKMASVMLAKVAEARALRRAFPADLSGLYTNDEMAQADEPKSSEPVQPPIEDETISEEEFTKIDIWLNGHDDLRNKLKGLCKIDDLKNIKISQKDAVKAYAKSYMQKQKDAKKDS